MSDEATCRATTCAVCGQEAKRLIQATQAGFVPLPWSGRPGLTDARSGYAVLSVLLVCSSCFRDQKKMAEAWEQDRQDIESEVATLGVLGELPGFPSPWTSAQHKPN